MRLKDPPLLAAAVTASGIVALAGHLTDKIELVWIFQPLIVVVCVWVAWQRGRLADHYARFIALGLAWTLVADLLRIHGDQVVVATAFSMIASISYLWASTADALLRPTRPTRLAIGAALVVGAAVVWTSWPALRDEVRWLAPIALLLLAWLAGLAVGRRASRVALGAGLLFVSTALNVLDPSHWRDELSIVWILAPFWAGQAMMALSIPERRQASMRGAT